MLVHVIKAKELRPPMVGGTADPPIREPLIENTITVYVKDHDVGPGRDDIIGAVTFKYDQIKKHGLKSRWVHIYG